MSGRNFEPFIKNFAVFLMVAIVIVFVNNACAEAKSTFSQKKVVISNKDSKTAAEILSLVDKYQKQYFTIVKRNDLFLDDENTDAVKNDRKELKKLYKEVKKQINNKQYLKKYKEIEKRYAKCDEITDTGIVEFERKYYSEVDALLNEVYKEVKSKISTNDFKNLTESEKKWLKEVENYKKVYESKGFGTIGSIIYYDYQIDMRTFRTLLLMLYL